MEQLDMALVPFEVEHHVISCPPDSWLATLLEMFPMIGMFFGF